MKKRASELHSSRERKPTRKLQIHRETLRRLEPQALRSAHAAAGTVVAKTSDEQCPP